MKKQVLLQGRVAQPPSASGQEGIRRDGRHGREREEPQLQCLCLCQGEHWALSSQRCQGHGPPFSWKEGPGPATSCLVSSSSSLVAQLLGRPGLSSTGA